MPSVTLMNNETAESLKSVIEKGSVEELLGPELEKVPWEAVVRGRITRDTVEELSKIKGEPDWMRRLRLRALEMFEKLPEPKWLPIKEEIDLESLVTYAKPSIERAKSWDEVPKEIRRYYEALGLPELEAKVLAGLLGQFDSEVVYLHVKKYLEEKGAIVTTMDEAVKRYPDLVKQYFTRVFPPGEHKFAALHVALWSGGTFVYVPPGVRLDMPIESFFLIGTSGEGQFEHSLIVADEGASVEWLEGCAAPVYKGFSFHDGMVEGFAAKNAHLRINTIQNWSRNIINFNNKRAVAMENATVEWVEGSLGSKVSYTYPSTVLKGEGARTSIIGVTIANGPFWKENGAKAYHDAPRTSSKIVNKSVSINGGTVVYRGLVYVREGARYAKSSVSCDSLILDDKSKAYTIPHDQVFEETATVTHEAYTGRLSEDKLFYLRSRGFDEGTARSLVVLGFIQDIVVRLPTEYAMTLNRVIELEFGKLSKVG